MSQALHDLNRVGLFLTFLYWSRQMKQSDTYFDVALSTSVVIFGFHNDQLQVLLCYKRDDPFKGAPSLPTNLVRPDEEVESVAMEVLESAIGENEAVIEQLNAFSKLYRKPEGRVVNIAQLTLIGPEHFQKSLSESYFWVPVCDIPTLIYDHNDIVDFAKERLKRRIRRRPVGFTLLPEEFTVRNIHSLYEQGLNKNLDRRNFYKKLVNSELLIDINKTKTENGSKKPSNLYAFNKKEYERLTLKGYDLKF